MPLPSLTILILPSLPAGNWRRSLKYGLAVPVTSYRVTLPLKQRRCPEKEFIRETHENLCCLGTLSESFSAKCVRALDRGFGAEPMLLLATRAVGYIGLTTAVKSQQITLFEYFKKAKQTIWVYLALTPLIAIFL